MLRCLTEGRHSARGEGRVLEARPGDLQRDREGGGAEEAGALRLLPRQGAVVAEHGRVRAVTARGRPPQRELQRGPGHRERGGGGPEVLHHRGGRCSGRQERRAGDVLRHRRLLRRARAHPKPAPPPVSEPATVAKILSIDKASFNRLLKVSDLLERSAKYS
ncbi:unnamed protein product [Prorocentrum cordatum]|uniref:Cyclic nucleotide-binding domain-containing protein n=1 Tax=Prorocentrum cordatum TaxID=2364126 RepID=A0ABN9V8P0_9DINO|nr:unnamed protein product [Polarella glacialis]